MPQFEWDPDKEAQNARKHGIDFTTASRIWDAPVLAQIDNRREYGEIRFQAFGAIDNRVVTVVFTWREQFAELSRPERLALVKRDYSKPKSATLIGDHQTDWSRFDAITDEEIDAAVRQDPDAPPLVDESWFASATLVMPQPKEQISIRLDRDVLEHFRRYPRYQTRINAILRAVMEHEKKAG